MVVSSLREPPKFSGSTSEKCNPRVAIQWPFQHAAKLTEPCCNLMARHTQLEDPHGATSIQGRDADPLQDAERRQLRIAHDVASPPPARESAAATIVLACQGWRYDTMAPAEWWPTPSLFLFEPPPDYTVRRSWPSF